MSLTDEERKSLVQLRLDKAELFLREAQQMVELTLWDLAANRFYYACFHATQALLVCYGLSAHTHAGTIATFGLNFVKSGKVDIKYGAFISRMEQLRKKADYNCDYDVSREDVESMVEPTKSFIMKIKKLIDER